MTHSLRVVCRRAVRDGFALAGVSALTADGDEAAAVVRGLVEQPETGVILIEQELYRALPEELREILERRALPIVIPFPGPARGDRPSTEVELVEMLRRAIGYRVRLR